MLIWVNFNHQTSGKYRLWYHFWTGWGDVSIRIFLIGWSGYNQPEPPTLLLLGLGAAVLRKRR